MKVIFHKDVENYLFNLVEILYAKEYFGFKESAYDYVDSLIDEIESTIHSKHKKAAPPYFSKYGKDMFYVRYRKNPHTQWYVFFNDIDGIYYVNFISNNHVTAQHL